jgi:hypothetical protein
VHAFASFARIPEAALFRRDTLAGGDAVS